MIRLVAVLAALAFAVPAAAETVQVRSGEHPGFSRLVVQLARPAGWTFGRTEGGYALRLDRADVSFDLSTVWRRIPRTRLRGIAPTADGLALATLCACHATVTELRPGILVLDLVDGVPRADSPFEVPLDVSAPAPAPPAVALPLTAGTTPAAETAWFWPVETPAPIGPRRSLATPVPADRVVEARHALVEQLARAAAQGLVDAEIERPDAPEPEPVAMPEPQPQPQPTPALDDHVGLAAETSFDRDGGTLAKRDPVDDDGLRCLPDGLFDVASWGNGEPASSQIAERRRALLGEFDAPSATAVADLARLYLYFGFGAEARATLQAFPVSVPDRDILESIASIVDDGAAGSPGRLAGMAGCDGAAALWAVLATPGPAAATGIDRGAVIRAFSDLPVALRRQLGPPLAGRFLDAGDAGTARAVHDAVTRAIGDAGAGTRLVGAALALRAGEDARGEAILEGVAAEDAAASPLASAELAEARLARHETFDTDAVASLAALAFQARGTPLGARLARAEVLATASTGNYDDAFAALARLERRAAKAPVPAALPSELFMALAQDAPDLAFLRHTVGEPHRLADPALGPDVRTMLARRLVALGFTAPAERLLEPDVDAPDARIVLSEAAVRDGDGRRALGILAGAPGTAAATVRGDALSRLDEHAAAADAYADAGAVTSEADAAWRAGDLERVRTLGDEDARATATGLLAELSDARLVPEAAPATDGALAAARALLEGSAGTRALVTRMLAPSKQP